MKFSFQMILLALATLCLSAKDHALSEFSGETPIMGLFGQTMPTEFFSQDMQGTYSEKRAYQTSFKVPSYGAPLVAYIANEEAFGIAVVVSAVRADGTSKNWMVRVPAMDVVSLELNPLSQFDKVMVLSQGSFQLQTNRVIVRNNRGTVAPQIEAPIPEITTSNLNTSCLDTKLDIVIANRAPSTPGSELAKAIWIFTPDGFFLNVEFPIGTTFHEANEVAFTRCGSGDVTLTHRVGSTKKHSWYGMMAFPETHYAIAQCYSAQSPETCKVEGTTTNAIWDISCP